MLEKRLGRDAAALEVFSELATARNAHRVTALEELAKHYEHRERNYAKALDYTRTALELGDSEELRHRAARLVRARRLDPRHPVGRPHLAHGDSLLLRAPAVAPPPSGLLSRAGGRDSRLFAARSPDCHTPSVNHDLVISGAREHNLKDITLRLPRDRFIVITGLSGSGKSSLAFDTIYAEGQRRYVETLSPYARQFLDQMERPDVDTVEGLSPLTTYYFGAQAYVRGQWTAVVSASLASAATLAMPSGMPMPRLTLLFGRSSSAARRAIILRSDIASVGTIEAGTRISPE
jgi:hypothetical protein